MCMVNQDYRAAALRMQIESLKLLYSELENEQLDDEALRWRIRAIQIQLQRIRERSLSPLIAA